MVYKQFSGLSMEPRWFSLCHCYVLGLVWEQVSLNMSCVCICNCNFHTLHLGLDLIFPNNIGLKRNFFGLEKWMLPSPEFHAGSWTELGRRKALLPLVVIFPLS